MTGKLTRTEINAGLRNQPAGGNMTPAVAFWRRFRAIAPTLGRERKPALAPLAVPRWAVATALAALVIALAGVWTFSGAKTRGSSSLISLDVLAAHQAVLVMVDDATQSTVLWIDGMEVDDENGGGT